MSRIAEYQIKLHSLPDWDDYLLKESGLPGPRGNIELAQAVANVGNLKLFRRYLTYTADIAPVDSPYEFLAFCGALGLGRLLADGDRSQLQVLRILASDLRWRMREAVAMALQRLGEVDMGQLLESMHPWSHGSWLQQLHAAPATCEPRLLSDAKYARDTLNILDTIMVNLDRTADRQGEDFIALRKGLGYCWSVAVAALPLDGKALMEKWLVKPDKGVQWIMQENLKKNRLVRTDAEWVEHWKKKN
jgi:hypothetical protein